MEETYLYRHFDKKDRLLYVGISLSLLQRLSQHKRNSHWFKKISKVVPERFASRELALEAEKKAIAEECPRHNNCKNFPTEKDSQSTVMKKVWVSRKTGIAIEDVVLPDNDLDDKFPKKHYVCVSWGDPPKYHLAHTYSKRLAAYICLLRFSASASKEDVDVLPNLIIKDLGTKKWDAFNAMNRLREEEMFAR